MRRRARSIARSTYAPHRNRLGPNLHNIIGRKAGSLQNYGYSSAMTGAGFVWDKEKPARPVASGVAMKRSS